MASNLEFPPQAMTSASNTIQGTYSDGTYVATSSSTYYDLSSFAFGAFDKILGTGYQQFWRSAGETYNLSYSGSNSTYIDNVPYYGEWVQIQMPNPVIVKSYRIGANPGALQEAPKSWRLAGSMDGSKWYTLDARQNVTYTSNTFNIYNLPQNNLYYTHLRLVALTTNDQAPPNGLGVASVGDLRFFGTIPYGIKDGAIEMAFYNQQYFPSVTADDMVIRTTDPSQKIHFGTLSNAMPALTISSNSMIVGSNAYILKRMAVGKSNAEYDLDVIGNINFTGSLFRNGQFYAGDTIVAGDGIWNSNEYGIVQSGSKIGVNIPAPEFRLDVRAGLGVGSNMKGMRIATELSNDVVGEGIMLSENAGLSNARQAIIWTNTNVDYQKARIWTETGADYSNTKFAIDVADSNQVLQPRIMVDVEGKVGIGQENPEARLHVQGDAIVTSNITIGGSITTGSAIQFQGLIIGKNTGTTANFSPFSVPGVSNEGGGSLAFYSQCNDSSGIRILNGNLQEMARFTNNGNLGLGDTTPGDKLSIEGSNPRMALYSATGFANGATAAMALFDTNSNNGFEWMFNKDSNMLYLNHYNSTFVPTPMVAIDNSNELIGIRTLNPAAPLVVSGATSNGVLKVTNNSVNGGDRWWIGYTLGNTNSTDGNDRVRLGAMNTLSGGGEFFVTTGQSGIQSERFRIDQYGRVGINTSAPSNAFLDVNSNMNMTAAVLGEKSPVCITCDATPSVALNAYYNNGWKRARGYLGQSKYGAMVELATDVGQLRFHTTNPQTNEGDAYNTNCVMRIHAATSNVQILGNTPPPSFDHVNKTIPMDFTSELVLDGYHTTTTGDMGQVATALEFRARNSSSHVWTTGTIIGTANPLSSSSHKGGLSFYTQPGYGDSNIGWMDERNRGGLSKLSMLLNHNQDALFYGNVGVNEAAPAAKLHVNGDILYTGVTKTAAISRMTPLYIRGTGLNNTGDRIVRLGNVSLILPQLRGLTLTIINTADHSHVSSTNYDTYGFTNESDNLATALNNLTRDRFGILTSWDAYEDGMTNNLRNAAVRLGLHKLAATQDPGSRRPYAAIFRGAGVGTANTVMSHVAVEVTGSDSAAASSATIGTYLIEDSFIGQNLHNALVGGDPNSTIPAVFAASNSDVGVGTIAPSFPLHIHRGSGNSGLQITNGVDATKYMRMGVNSTSHFIEAYGNHPLTFTACNEERMRIHPSGLLSIGTTNSFAGKLYVSGDAVIGPDTGPASLIINDVATAKWRINTGNFDLTFSKHTGTQNTDYSSWDRKVVFGDTGTIGIGGMTDPAARLHVYTPTSYTGDVMRFDALNEPSVYQLGLTAAVPSGGIVTWSYYMKNANTTYNNVLTFDRGSVGIGVSAPSQKLHVAGSIAVSTGNAVYIGNPTVGDAALNVRDLSFNLASFYYGTGKVGSITTNSTTTAYNTTSDYRLKENIVPLENASAKVLELKPKQFNFKSDPSITYDGFLAHEVAEVIPYAVHGEKDAVDEHGDPKYQMLDQSKLVPLLTQALQDALKEIADLKMRVAALERR